ncbi:MAG: NAD-binding protein [Promethearchaeota archaeon]
MIFWFLGNFIYFSIKTSSSYEALLIIFYFKHYSSLYGNFYASFTEFIIFGLIFSLITIDLFRKYNPADTSRELARFCDNHVVIIGYNHVGKRIVDYFHENTDYDVVIIEKRENLVKDLIENELAVINDDALKIETLKDASIEKARAVYVMSDNLEVQLVVNANIRELNKYCKLVCRVFEDDIGDLIAKTYNAIVISTSKFASEIIFKKISKHNYKKILLIGLDHIALRLIEKIKQRGNIDYYIIEEDEEKIEQLMIPKETIIIGDPKEELILGRANVLERDCIINTISDVTDIILITRKIRELNSKCKIFSRFFLDSVAEVLERPPFRSKVISSSKQTLKIMTKEGILDLS